MAECEFRKELRDGIGYCENPGLDNLIERNEKLHAENARLRTQNAKLAGANANLREQVSVMRSAGEFIDFPAETEIDDCDFATCAYGLEAGSSGFCSADDATGEAGCPAHLKICSACAGSGVEG